MSKTFPRQRKFKHGKGNSQQRELYMHTNGALSCPGKFSHPLCIYSFFIHLYLMCTMYQHCVEFCECHREHDRHVPIIKFSLVWKNEHVIKIIVGVTKGKQRVLQVYA